MNNLYFSPVILPLIAVVGACSSLLKPAHISGQATNDLLIRQVASGDVSGSGSNRVQLDTMLDDLGAKITNRGMVINLGNDSFGTDQSPLNPSGMLIAKKLAAVLVHQPHRNVLVEAFTDSSGSASHNQELSERRAIAVRSALQELGVSRDRVSIRGYGEAYPLADNDTARNRQLNRRVEIVLSDAFGKIMARKS